MAQNPDKNILIWSKDEVTISELHTAVELYKQNNGKYPDAILMSDKAAERYKTILVKGASPSAFMDIAIKPRPKQGEKGRPPVDINEYFRKIEPFLKAGYSLYRASLLGGVPYSTIWDYYKQDPSFSEKVESLINAPSVRARQVWIEKINAGDYGAAKDWLERRERSEFATRQEQTGADGEPLPAMKVIFVDDDDSEQQTS